MDRAADYGVTHGLDFARWITEIAELLKKTDASDPQAQVSFLEIAKTLERLRKYKKDLLLGAFRQMLIVNETPITSYPICDIIGAPLVRLMAAAGLHSIGVDHRIDIRNVQYLAEILAHPEEPKPISESLKYVTMNPVQYLVVKAEEWPEHLVSPGAAPGSGPLQSFLPTPGEGSAAKVDEMYSKEADVDNALSDAFAGWGGEDDDPLRAAARDMVRKVEEVLPSLENLAKLDNKAPQDFLRNYFEKQFREMSSGKSVDQVLDFLGAVLRATSPEVQDQVFRKRYKSGGKDEAVDALRQTSPEFRTNFLLDRMKAVTTLPEIKKSAELLVAPGGEVAMMEHIAGRLLAADLAPDVRSSLQKLTGAFGFDPSRVVRRRIALYIGTEGGEYGPVYELLTKRGYGVILWDGQESEGSGQEMETDIAILDATTAGEQGEAALRRIAEANTAATILVIAKGDPDTTNWMELGAGRVGILKTPVEPETLLAFFEDAKTGTRPPMVGEVPGTGGMRESTSKYIKADLQRAREIQERLIPREVPLVPGADIAIAYRPCSEVGGDYLDLFWIAPNQLAFVIADVSGKGVAAAMVMVMARSVFRTVAAAVKSPRETILHVNRMLSRDVKKGIFVSAIYGVYEVDANRVRMANGGHNPPVFWQNGAADYLPVSGMALGLTERPSFENSIKEQVFDLAPGERMLFYTDGVTEAIGPGGLMYGEDRLLSVFGKEMDKSAKDLLDLVMGDIDHFVGRTPRSDDTTMLVIGRSVRAMVEQV
jgi:hypothetical protein